MQGWNQEFLFGGLSYNANIFIKTTPHTHTRVYIHAFFIIIYTHFFFEKDVYTLFYLISYIHTHTKKKKSLVFLITIMFDSDLS